MATFKCKTALENYQALCEADPPTHNRACLTSTDLHFQQILTAPVSFLASLTGSPP